MNVFGKRERSWRKARKRGVSPIIATILLVAITVVLAAVLYVLISGLTHGPGNTPIGTAFSAGNAVSSVCASGATYATNGCKAGDYVYTLTVETATASFSSVLFEVKTGTGAVLVAASVGGFTVTTVSGAIAAQMTTASTTLAMTSTFGTYGASPICNGAACGPSTTFSSIYSIVIDMGTGNPTGQGYSFVAVGTGSYSGTTSPLALP